MIRTLTKVAMIAALCGVGVTGCATSSRSVTTEGAPITYKIGKGGTQLASISRAQRSNPSSRPQFAAPSRLPDNYPQAIESPRGAQGREFDPSNVDTQLYSHQKVGRRYTIMGKSYTPRHEPYYDQIGTASWYGPKFHGKPTATGEIFDQYALTAAHQTLPLNSMLYVTNLSNNRTIMVRLNDRGPFIGDRILDLSKAAAEALDYTHMGTTNVRIQYAGPADPMAAGRSVPKIAPRAVPAPRENIAERPQQTRPQAVQPQYQPPQYEPPQYQPPVAQSQPTPRRPSPPSRPVAQAERMPNPPAPTAPTPLHGDELAPGENVTLTIKGPIHIARSDNEQDNPIFIQERLYTGQAD